MISSSTVWEYYRKIAPDQAECIVCSKIIKTGGGTTNVRSHLKSRHKEYLLDDVESQRVSLAFQPESKLTEVILGNDDVVQEVFQIEHMPSKPRKSRSRSRERYRRRETDFLYDRSNSPKSRRRELSFLDALTFMIYKDNKPVEIVEEEGFRQFMKVVAPLNEIPSKDTITEMISTQYEKKKANAVEKMKKLDFLSLSFHMSTVCSRFFVAVAAHFFSQSKQKPEMMILGIRPLTSILDHEYISSEIHDVLELFDIQESKIVSVCTDGSPHITTAVKSLFGEKKHIQCMAVILKDVIKDGLEDTSNSELQQLVNDVELILTDAIFNNSQNEQLIQSISKDCYSTTDKFVLALPHVEQVLATSTLENNHFNDGLIAEINEILTLFQTATREIMANEQLTGSVVIPVISCIKSALKNMNPTHEAVKLLRGKLLLSMIMRTENYLSNPLLCQATLCDPRFQQSYLSPFAVDQCVSVCTNEVKLHLRALRRHPRFSNCDITTNEDNPLWCKHDKTMAEGGFNSHVEADTSIVSEDEIKLYLGQELLPRNTDPIKFWLQSKGCMPGLSHVALKNLTVVSCRIPAEVFVPSLDSLLKFEKCGLTDDQLTQRIFLRCNEED